MSCSQQVARIWIDYQVTTILQRDNLQSLSRLSKDDLQALNPTLDAEALDVVWSALNPAGLGYMQQVRQHIEQFQEISLKDRLLIDRLSKAIDRWIVDATAEQNLVSLTEEFGFIGQSRITTLDLMAAIDERLLEFNVVDAIQRYTSDQTDVFDYIQESASFGDFQKQIFDGIIAPDSSYKRLITRGIELYHQTIAGRDVFSLDNSFQLDDLSIELYESLIRGGSTSLPSDLILSIYRSYSESILEGMSSNELAVEFSEHLEKARVLWKQSFLAVSPKAPQYIKRLIPLLYYLRTEVATASNQVEKIKALLFFDIFAQPGQMLRSRIDHLDNYLNLIALSRQSFFGGYVHLRGLNVIHFGNPQDNVKVFAFLSVLQSALIFSRITGLVAVPNWVFVLSIVFAALIHPRPQSLGR